ncbi:MAG: hypothetical protein ACOC80_13970 [Petrotogales bacterium]
MPKFDDNTQLDTFNGNHFGFSAVKIDDLKDAATEYTLVTIVADRSGSTQLFYRDMEKTIESVVDACRKNPRADNLMLRVVAFDNKQEEIHGFKLINDINKGDYDGCLSPGGMTALFDACVDAIDATAEYGRILLEQDYDVNAIVFIMTDGMENSSRLSEQDANDAYPNPRFVREALERAIQNECVESINTVLIAVNIKDAKPREHLERLNQDVNFTQYVEMEDATPNNLAKLGNFISQSISSTSQAITSGSPSESISITF